jgi:hypothetical protein
MQHAWQLRSAWAWRCRQRKAKRSRGGVGRLGTAIGVGGEEALALGLTLALVLNPGVIAGGAEAVASIATGGSGRARAASPLGRAAHAKAAGSGCQSTSAVSCGFGVSRRLSIASRAGRPGGERPLYPCDGLRRDGWRRRRQGRPPPRRSRSACRRFAGGAPDALTRHQGPAIPWTTIQSVPEIEARSRRDRDAPCLDLRLDTLTS